MIVIVDYGVGNIASLLKAFGKIGVAAAASGDIDAIMRADKLVLPGVGNFGAAMDELRRRGLAAPLTRKVLDEGAPVLGVCLGMQLLTRRSEEGEGPGLGWINAETRRLRPSAVFPDLKVPNMGWRTLDVVRPGGLLADIGKPWRFYFAHSYHVAPEDPSIALAFAQHGEPFVAAVGCGNIMGVQFHPEKSHQYGFRLLRAFAETGTLAIPPAGRT